MGFELTIDDSDITEFKSRLDVFSADLENAIDSGVEKTANELLSNIWKIGQSRNVPDSVLGRYQRKQVDTMKWKIFNNESEPNNLSAIMEVGASEHTIEPNTASYLVFEPKSGTIDQYPDGAITSDGMVKIQSVDHPGMEGRHYFRDSWRLLQQNNSLERNVRREVNKLKDEVF